MRNFLSSSSGRIAWLKPLLAVLALTFVLPAPADAKKRRKRVGHLVIESMTDGAKVYVDGKLLGKTPFEMPLPIRAGKHKLKATKFGFSSLELDIKIRNRRSTEVMIDLVPHSGLVKFTCNVETVEVYVDGKLLGNAPLIKNVPLGDHEVMLVKDGYNDFSTKLNVKAGEKHFVEGVLTPFLDFSPEVLAMKKAQEEERQYQAEAAAKVAANPSGPLVDPAPAWYEGLHERWWFWTAVGAVVVTAVVVPVAATQTGGEQSGLSSHDSPIDPIKLP
jgi:hypothetical protein